MIKHLSLHVHYGMEKEFKRIMNDSNYDDLDEKKLKVKNVVTDSIELYRNYFKAFISLSSIIFIISLISNIVDYLHAHSINKYSFAILYFLIRIVLFFITILVNFRAEIAIYMIAQKKNNSPEIYEIAFDFYNSLLKKSDEELLKNNFSREEVYQGFRDMKKLKVN